MRICSFLPSATEIVYALGLGDSLMAVSHECDFPTEALAKPKVVRSKFDASSLSGKEIDRVVSEMYARGERIYEVDQKALEELKPELVLTQELCDVCAVSYEDVQQAVVQLEMPPVVMSLDPGSIGDVLQDIENVGRFTGTLPRAKEIAAELQSRIYKVRSQAASAEDKPRVACIEWLEPTIVAGHWVPEMVEMAGGVDALAEPGQPSKRITMDDLRNADPDVLLMMPCGMGVTRGVKELSGLENLGEWKELRAVREGRAYMADASAYFSRSGPRLVDALELLAQVVQPGIFDAPLQANDAVRLTKFPAAE
ncbi:MAG: hypothetical protein BZY79_06640 [SAR202 cluster bacterium Casp-Chloro-G4]|nr:MAG: hypothetical protein BZY79_06640 [SAR202 cluster bacterium Casp-Chloro-G4]